VANLWHVLLSWEWANCIPNTEATTPLLDTRGGEGSMYGCPTPRPLGVLLTLPPAPPSDVALPGLDFPVSWDCSWRDGDPNSPGVLVAEPPAAPPTVALFSASAFLVSWVLVCEDGVLPVN
jgi:hypothetical protein